MFKVMLSLALFTTLSFSSDSPKEVLCKYLSLINNYDAEFHRYLSAADKEIVKYSYVKEIMIELDSKIVDEVVDPKNIMDVVKNSYSFKPESKKLRAIPISSTEKILLFSFFKINKSKFMEDRIEVTFLEGPLARYPSETFIFDKLMDKYSKDGAPYIENKVQIKLIKEYNEWKIFLNLKDKTDILNKINGGYYENRRFGKKDIGKLCS